MNNLRKHHVVFTYHYYHILAFLWIDPNFFLEIIVKSMHPIGLQNYYTSPFYDDLSFLSSQLSKSWYLLLFSFMYIYLHSIFK